LLKQVQVSNVLKSHCSRVVSRAVTFGKTKTFSKTQKTFAAVNRVRDGGNQNARNGSSLALDSERSERSNLKSFARPLPPGSPHTQASRRPFLQDPLTHQMPAVQPTPKALHSLITSIPAKTLHAYLLDNIPAAPPDTLTALASFFETLSPPPLLHCVRCHEDYMDIENGDHSCRMPHDEESMEIEYVGYHHGHSDSEYDTTYCCCEKVVEGEGDDGPPSGWCFEGKHTVSPSRHSPGVETIIAICKISTLISVSHDRRT
jgi:hypothetical protein